MADPKVLQSDLISLLVQIMKREGVQFIDNKSSYADRCWGLYKALLLFAPAVVIASGLPVSIYGVGSFRISTSSSGKRKFKIRYSLASRFLDYFLLRVGYLNTFWRIYKDLTKAVVRPDSSVMEARSRLSFEVEDEGEANSNW